MKLIDQSQLKLMIRLGGEVRQSRHQVMKKGQTVGFFLFPMAISSELNILYKKISSHELGTYLRIFYF